MTDREALLAAIKENPDDDGPRLIYADCIQDAGEDQRAEFIRAQVLLARFPELKFRQGDILARRRAAKSDPDGDYWLEHEVHNPKDPESVAWGVCGKDVPNDDPEMKRLAARVKELWKPPMNRTMLLESGLARLFCAGFSLTIGTPDIGSARCWGIVQRGFIDEFHGTWDIWTLEVEHHRDAAIKVTVPLHERIIANHPLRFVNFDTGLSFGSGFWGDPSIITRSRMMRKMRRQDFEIAGKWVRLPDEFLMTKYKRPTQEDIWREVFSVRWPSVKEWKFPPLIRQVDWNTANADIQGTLDEFRRRIVGSLGVPPQLL